MKSIDLHGMIEEEAVAASLMALLSLREGEEIEIITGNGIVLKDVVIETIIEEGFSYRYQGFNEGSIIVYK